MIGLRLWNRVFSLVLCTAFFAAPVFAAEDQAPRLLVHLLNYLKKDYPGAVENGRILDQGEYAEQVEFAASVQRMIREIPALSTSKQLAEQAKQLAQLIGRRASTEAVVTAIAPIMKEVLVRAPMTTKPMRWPDLKLGQALYGQHCAQCHGAEGRGDGVRAAALDPKPANFLSPEFPVTSPFHAYNSVRLGVPGTGMAGFDGLGESEVWAVAFYVHALRYGGPQKGQTAPDARWLSDVAGKTDEELKTIAAPEGSAPVTIAQLRKYPGGGASDSVAYARAALDKALQARFTGDFDSARLTAIDAYLSGLEPAEPYLRAKNGALLIEAETVMAELREAYERRRSTEIAEERTTRAKQVLVRVEQELEVRPTSPGVAFGIAYGIVFREAFEAGLLLVTLLGVVRAAGSVQAALFVHGGWILALLLGVVGWFFSGWLLALSGAGRELLEAFVGTAAVLVLLYVGFWLHRTTEMGRWRTFLKDLVDHAVTKKNLFVLGSVAFMAVFREVVETVLFLRALVMEVGPAREPMVLLGVLASFLTVALMVTIVVRFSVRLPLRQLFNVSSVVMVGLAVILTGKAMRAFQETGLLPATDLPLRFRLDFVGLYPTWETFLPQLVVAVLACALWGWNRRSSAPVSKPA